MQNCFGSNGLSRPKVFVSSIRKYRQLLGCILRYDADERNIAALWDGVQIGPGRNLEVGKIDVVISQPGHLKPK